MFLLLFLLQPPASAEELILLSGEKSEATITAIGQDGALSGDSLPAGLDLDGLRSVRLSPVENSAAKIEVRLAPWGRLQAEQISVVEERCRVQLPGGLAFELPLEAVRGIRYNLETTQPAFEQAVAQPSAEFDRVFVQLENGQLQSVNGLIEELQEGRLSFHWQEELQTLPTARLYGIAVAQVPRSDIPPGHRIFLRDGSQVWAKDVSLENGELQITTIAGAELRLPWEKVSSIDVHSRRMTFLSDLSPKESEQKPLVTFSAPMRRDRSVGGNTLTLGGREYEKGLGVHSYSKLGYALTQSYDLFAATIGIDAETGGKGDCEFIVQTDGEERFRRRLKATDAPFDLQLDITNVRRLTLIVEPGADLDLADHADWADARLIRRLP